MSLYVFFVTGQSNSQGYGGYADICDARDHCDHRILSWNINTNAWEVANLFSEIGTKPANNQCFAFHFAKELLKIYPGIYIGLIVIGCPGTSICNWTIPNPFLSKSSVGKVDTGQFFYTSAEHIKNALAVANGAMLNGILWHQGEADADEEYLWYYQRITQVIQQYRNFFGHIPFIVGELLDYSLLNKQNFILRHLNNLPGVRCANLAQCQHSGDAVHMSTEGHRFMGKAYAERLIELY